MADANLKIVVGADVQGAVNGMKQVEQATKQTGQTFEVFNSTANISSGRMKQIEDAVKGVNEAVKPVVPGVGALAEKVQDVDKKGQSLLGTLVKQRIAFMDVGRVIEGQSFSLRSLSQNFSLLGPEVTIVAAALGYLAEQSGIFSQAQDMAAEAVKHLTENLESEKAIADDNIADIKRNTAERISQAKLGANAEVAAINIKLDGLRKEKQQRDNILYDTRHALDQFGTSGEDLDDKEREQERKRLVAAEHAAAQAFKDVTNEISITENERTKAIQDNAKRQADALARVLDQVKKVREEIARPPAKSESIHRTFEIAQAGSPESRSISANVAKAIQDGVKDPENRSAFAELAQAYRDLLSKNQNQDQHSHINFTLANPDDADMETLADRMKLKNLKVDVPVNLKFEEEKAAGDPERLKAIREVYRQLQTSAEGMGPIKLAPGLKLDFDKMVDKQMADDAAKQLGNKLAQVLENVSISGLESIGKAIGTGSFKNFFSGIESAIGDALESFGKTLIATSSIIETAKEALNVAFENPYVAIAAGAAMIVAGAAIKSLSNKQGIKAFAEGGIVTGPTMGLIGEAGPEVVFPLDKLNKFVQSTSSRGGANIHVTGEISGRNLALVQARDSKLQNLTS